MARKDLLTRLADAGEEAIGRLGEAPGADRLAGVANSMRDRMDELQKRVRGIEALERRVDELERRVEELASAQAARRRAPARPPSPTRSTGAPGRASARRGTSRPPRGGTGSAETGESATEPEGPDAASGPIPGP